MTVLCSCLLRLAIQPWNKLSGTHARTSWSYDVSNWASARCAACANVC
ncbi:MAG: hypothetical protein ACKERG_04710 [Candidatus Hodgkinia cicadicola]